MGVTQDIIMNEDYFMSIQFKFFKVGCTVPTVKGKIPERLRQISSVIDDTGRMFIFGGGADEIIGSPTTQLWLFLTVLNCHG